MYKSIPWPVKVTLTIFNIHSKDLSILWELRSFRHHSTGCDIPSWSVVDWLLVGPAFIGGPCLLPLILDLVCFGSFGRIWETSCNTLMDTQTMRSPDGALYSGLFSGKSVPPWSSRQFQYFFFHIFSAILRGAFRHLLDLSSFWH